MTGRWAYGLYMVKARRHMREGVKVEKTQYLADPEKFLQPVKTWWETKGKNKTAWGNAHPMKTIISTDKDGKVLRNGIPIEEYDE